LLYNSITDDGVHINITGLMKFESYIVETSIVLVFDYIKETTVKQINYSTFKPIVRE